MSDDKQPEPKLNEPNIQAQYYAANSNIDAHLIADMLRIESISTEVKVVAEEIEKFSQSQQAHNQKIDVLLDELKSQQIETSVKSESFEDSLGDIKNDIKEIRGWIFAMIAVGITGLITVVVTLFSGAV
jgi:hypothetical protein